MSDKKGTYLNTRTRKSSSQKNTIGVIGFFFWWGVTVFILGIICVILGVPLTMGLFIALCIAGLYLSPILAVMFGVKKVEFGVKPKHADVIEILNRPLPQDSEGNKLLTEQQFRLIQTEINNLCYFYSIISELAKVREHCDTILPIKNEDGTDWDITLKMKYALISDVYKCFLALGHDIDADNSESLGLFLFLTKFVESETEITYDNCAYYKANILDSLKGVLNLSKELTDGVQFPQDKFIFHYVLGKYDKDYQLKYMNYLYRFSSAISKTDAKVIDQEIQGFSGTSKSTEDEDFSKSVEKSKPQESDSDASPMEELHKLIGLSSVKEEIERLTSFIKIQQVRKEKGLKLSKISYHCIFTGNPGTGKTTVARILAGIYKDLGIIKKGHLIETDRSGLVAEYVGQTAVKTNKIIDSALDGVLFIDEAYSLVQGSGNDYGQEAISTLLKRMEDNRERLIVILAGYSEEMKEFIDSNPGLQSRFNRYIDFQDYTSQQLFDIFMMNVKKHDYTINQKAQDKLKQLFEEVVENKDNNFGNARYVRNIFEKTLENQAMRLASLTCLTKENLSEITEVDIL